MKHDRSLHVRAGRVGSSRPKRSMSVQQALEWAFRVEHAQLELPEQHDPEQDHGFGFGLEYVLLQRAILGCKVDGGQYKIGSYTHEDAEVIAATVAGEEPETAANNIQAITEAMAKPPRIWPILSIAKSMIRLATPPVDKKAEDRIKKGIASRV